jgi:protein-S-isoprenylcysteine O-methyltransferase Ste14
MTRQTKRPLTGAIIGTIVFVLVMPGSVIGLVPFLLSGWRLQPPLLGMVALRWLGALLLLLGTPVFIDFVVRFVREGRGTPVPVAPTQRLVVGGPFRYVRNPGYLAVLSMISGQGLFLGNEDVLLYAFCVAIGFHLFVVLYEEPALRRQFGARYQSYCSEVPRWIPRRTPAKLGDSSAK